jgi:pyruvate dehydrogenase E2 component (dihydrolipoamide acetyltransferase)
VVDFGSNGADRGVPTLHHPQTGALGVGQVSWRPVALQSEGGEYLLTARPIVVLTLAYDNRVIDNGTAGEFLADVKAILER